MRFANVLIEGAPHLILAEGNSISLVRSVRGIELTTTDELLALPDQGFTRSELDLESIPGETALKYRPSVVSPEKIILAAVNYRSHSRENRRSDLTSPYFFGRFRNSLIGPFDDLVLPRNSIKIDWEAELSVIIGKKGKYISSSSAMEYIAGYSISNDFSWREQQMEVFKGQGMGSHWYTGKSFDASFPLGPYLVTQDDIGDPGNLAIRLSVNGKTMQDGSSSDMIFDIPALVEKASVGITLLPGDVISTGTPSGVAYFSGKPFIKAGDRIRTEIEGIGHLENVARAEYA